MDYRKRFDLEREWRYKYGMTVRDWLVDSDDCCMECNGSGYILYGSTATWRGGIGGASMTNDVCNKCWGSGSKTKSWPAHSKDGHGLI